MASTPTALYTRAEFREKVTEDPDFIAAAKELGISIAEFADRLTAHLYDVVIQQGASPSLSESFDAKEVVRSQLVLTPASTAETPVQESKPELLRELQAHKHHKG